MRANPTDLFATIRHLSAQGLDAAALERELWNRFGPTQAVLVLDSTGFSAVTRSHGIVHFLHLIARMREIARKTFATRECLDWRTEADNCYAHFTSVEGALHAAQEINRAILAEHLMSTDDVPFQVCVGIGYGHLLLAGEESAYGEEMNLASKLGEDIAKGGEILLTRAAYDNLAVDHRRLFTAQRTRISGVVLFYYQTLFSPDP